MKNLSSLINLSVFFISMALVFIACNSNNSSPANSATPNSTSATASPATQLTGNLDTLYMSVEDFKKLKNRVVFRFYITDSSHLTLHGWFGRGQHTQKWTFDTLHNTSLSLYSQSKVTYGPGDYFGDLLLHDTTRQRLDIMIKYSNPKAIYVLFEPEVIPASEPFGGQLIYNISLTNREAILKSASMPPNPFTTPTGAKTNPCPPGSGE